MAARPELYLDWNATTPLHASVIERMREALDAGLANPSSLHAAGRRAQAVVENCREQAAAVLGVDPRDVVLTSGGTEANNLALSGAKGLITSRLEHPSIVRVAEVFERQGGGVVWLDALSNGSVRSLDVERALERLPRGSTLAISAVNHETGRVHDLAELSELAAKAGAHLHVDAVQAIGKVAPSTWRYGDTRSVAAHKIRGPKGIGALAFRPGWSLQPVLRGGAQERGLRPGTLDPVAAAGFGAALERVETMVETYMGLRPIRDQLERRLSRWTDRNGDEPRAQHVTNLSFRGRLGDELVAALDLEGVQVSSGSACSAGSAEPSAVITAMLGVERARSAVRISLGEDSTEAVIASAIEVFERVLERGQRPNLET
jgi:cysteine desulfurase